VFDTIKARHFRRKILLQEVAMQHNIGGKDAKLTISVRNGRYGTPKKIVASFSRGGIPFSVSGQSDDARITTAANQVLEKLEQNIWDAYLGSNVDLSQLRPMFEAFKKSQEFKQVVS
jgi:hypothetical protein